MATGTITTVTAARAAANDWLITPLPDRFAAGIPAYEPTLMEWRIPVWLSYPQAAPLRPVGELRVDARASTCLRMVLGTLGVDGEAERLRHLTDCSPFRD